MSNEARGPEMEQLALDIIGLLKEYGMFYDVCIYANGKKWAYDSTAPNQYTVEDGVDPNQWLNYVASDHLLSMSFEGPLYHALNYYEGGHDEFLDRFTKLFYAHNIYYELGEAWSLSCYNI